MIQLFQKEAIFVYRFYVSSYAKGKEKGLYVCNLDETKNELHLNKHVPTDDFPSYVIKKDDYLYELPINIVCKLSPI